MRKIYIVIILLFGCYLWAIKSGLLPNAIFNIPNNALKRKNIQLSTSTNYRYKREFNKTLDKYISFKNLYQKKISSAIPGLQYTEMDGKSSSQMVPQGICIAGDYMLITAYDNGIEYQSTGGKTIKKQKPSVIYVLSNKNPSKRKFLTTVVLPDINHVGGIAYDGKRVWIAKGTSKKCSVIEYQVIDKAVQQRKDSFILQEYNMEVSCGVTASFLTFYDGKLWIGTYQSRLGSQGSLQSYWIDEMGENIKLRKQYRMSIPAYANGITFAKIKNKICMAIASSYGRYGNSKIYLYEVENKSYRDYYVYKGAYDFPPMAEEMVWDGEITYFLFESAATCYSTYLYRRCSYPVDRICGVSTQELFYWVKGIIVEQTNTQKGFGFYNLWADHAYLDREKYLRLLKRQEKENVM
jgi:hypothetical protein